MIWLLRVYHPPTHLLYLQDRNNFKQPNTFHSICYPTLRSSLPGISELVTCFKQLLESLLSHSKHTPRRLQLSHHGLPTNMAFSTPVTSASHANIDNNCFYKPPRPGLCAVPLDSGSRQHPPGTQTLQQRAAEGDVSYSP